MDADDRANKLYWGSDRSVNQIADELDLSKGALYEMIRPLSAGLGCPLCGAEVVHPNRTAKDRARVDCAGCGWDGTEDEAIPLKGAGQGPRPTGPAMVADPDSDDLYPENDFDAPGPPPAVVTQRRRPSPRLVAGGAILGAAMGLALVLWARRR